MIRAFGASNMARGQSSDAMLTPGTVHVLANRLRRYFCPVSLFPPPGINRKTTGNRNVAVSGEISPNTSPMDSTIVQLVPAPMGGTTATVRYRFATKFKNPPVVAAMPISAGAGGLLVLQGRPDRAGAVVNSSDPTDNRLVHLIAIGNPD